MNDKQKSSDFPLRSYQSGEESKIVDFLNLCLPGGWGDIEQWQWFYPLCPSFRKDNIFIIEDNNKIIGHRGLHFRELVLRKEKVPIVFMGDTATHPGCRGRGLYRRLHEATLKSAKRKGACLALTGNSRGSITYNHNKQTGFTEIRRSRTYIKPINYQKYFAGQVTDFLAQRAELQALAKSLAVKVYIYFGEAEYSLDDMIGGGAVKNPAQDKKGQVRITLSEKALPSLIRIVVGGKLKRVVLLLRLFLSRKIKIRFSSATAFMNFCRTMARAVRYV